MVVEEKIENKNVNPFSLSQNGDEYQLESLNQSENEITETLSKQQNGNVDHNNNEEEIEEVITEEPKPLHMEIPDHPVDSDDASSITVSEIGSGYQDDTNECHEFCLDFCTCFGLFSTCCPSTGEGFVTSCASFCGTFLVSCIKC